MQLKPTKLRVSPASAGRPAVRPTAAAAAARPPTGEVRAAPEIPNFPALPVPWGLGRPAFFTETGTRVGVSCLGAGFRRQVHCMHCSDRPLESLLRADRCGPRCTVSVQRVADRSRWRSLLTSPLRRWVPKAKLSKDYTITCRALAQTRWKRKVSPLLSSPPSRLGFPHQVPTEPCVCVRARAYLRVSLCVGAKHT